MIPPFTFHTASKKWLQDYVNSLYTKVPQHLEVTSKPLVKLIIECDVRSRDIVAIKLQVTNQLKSALEEDIEGAITTFGRLTKKSFQPKAVSKVRQFEARQSTPSNNSKTAQLQPSKDNSSNAPLASKITIEELLSALNHLSRFSSNYIGSKLTANYWQLTRPNFKWLDNFQINQSAKIAFSGVITEPISALQHQWVKEWTAAFIKQCSQIIQDLSTIIEQSLDERKKAYY